MEKYKKQLKEYIGSMEKSGYNIEAIQQQLHKHGHAKHVIEEAVLEMKSPLNEEQGSSSIGTLNDIFSQKNKEDEHESKSSPSIEREQYIKKNMVLGKERLFISLYFISVIVFIFWLSSVNNAPLSKVFLSFIPVIVTVILVILILETQLQRIKVINWVLPIITSVVFYVLVMPKKNTILTNIDVGNITVTNFILSIAFVSVMELIMSLPVKFGEVTDSHKLKGDLVSRTTKRKTTSELSMSEDSASEMQFSKKIEEYIQSIEDKCKAINFVIGRVYSNRHGGTERLRDSIKISSDWYNEFSKINQGNMEENLVLLKKVLWSIYDRLLLIGKQENEVFKKKELAKLAVSERDKMGEETIIDVLKNNDKDPVLTYYQSALDFCHKATEELKTFEDKTEKHNTSGENADENRKKN